MPRFAHVKLIAAIGNFGQIGQGNKLPWHDRRDLAHFKALTMGGLCVVGWKTAQSLPTLGGRDLYVWRREDNCIEFAEKHADRDIWICGGAAIYKTWRPYIGMSIITHIDHNPKADVYMPFLWRMPGNPDKAR